MWGAILAAAIALAMAANTGARLGGAIPRKPVADQAGLLAQGIEIRRPAGVARAPVGLLFSGCDGPRDNLDRWAEMLTDAGWAAAIVDSHGPRGFDADPVWRLICTGQLLAGPERAGDVAVAMDLLRRDPGLDTGRMVLIGASHGGWAVLELLGFDARGRRPDGLARWPGSGRAAAMAGLSGVIVLYPYCGRGARMARAGWTRPVPVLMLLVENDAITGTRPCTELAGRMVARGLPVTTHVYPGVTHGFDQQDRSAVSPLRFDAATTRDALARGRAFLDALP